MSRSNFLHLLLLSGSFYISKSFTVVHPSGPALVYQKSSKHESLHHRGQRLEGLPCRDNTEDYLTTSLSPKTSIENSWLPELRIKISKFLSAVSLVAFTTSMLVAPSAIAETYDGFADYAKDNQMEQSDVGCFVNKCGDQTKSLFSNPRGIKGVVCLGKCKGEQSCATRCFAQYGSESLDNWLSCTIEDNECVKVPKNVDNSAEEVGFPSVVRNFDPKTLAGTWYKTDGLNPNYDLFDCQTNTFRLTSSSSDNDKKAELDMDIFLRLRRPEESGGGFWENALTEHMVVDGGSSGTTVVPDVEGTNASPTMYTAGKMYGLSFNENWYILGESDGSKDIPPFKLVAYKGHTLQGNYEGAFVYAKEPILPEAARPAVQRAAAKAGLNFDDFSRIDNTCPAGVALNNGADTATGSSSSSTDWVDLIVGEGGVIDWISPGWRGEYKK